MNKIPISAVLSIGDVLPDDVHRMPQANVEWLREPHPVCSGRVRSIKMFTHPLQHPDSPSCFPCAASQWINVVLGGRLGNARGLPQKRKVMIAAAEA